MKSQIRVPPSDDIGAVAAPMIEGEGSVSGCIYRVSSQRHENGVSRTSIWALQGRFTIPILVSLVLRRLRYSWPSAPPISFLRGHCVYFTYGVHALCS